MAEEHSILQNEEIHQLLERGEAAGFLGASEIADAIEAAELEPPAVDYESPRHRGDLPNAHAGLRVAP